MAKPEASLPIGGLIDIRMKKKTGLWKRLLPLSKLAASGAPLSASSLEGLYSCQLCGHCVLSCPLVKASASEIYGPRAKIALLRAYAENRLAKEELLPLLSTCLHCGQCEKACPASLPLNTLFAEAAKIMRSKSRSLWSRIFYIAQSFPSLAVFFQRPLTVLLQMRHGKKGLFFGHKLPMAPFSAVSGKKATPADQEGTVLLFSGCLARHMDPSIASAAVRMAQNFKKPVLAPALPCCGRVNRLAGQSRESLALVRANLEILADLEHLPLLVACPSCLDEIRNIWPQLPDLADRERELATRIAQKTLDINEFFFNKMSRKSLRERGGKIFFHFSCLTPASSKHLIQKLLSPGEGNKAAFGQECCGAPLACPSSALNFNGDLSAKVGRELRDRIIEAKADQILVNCPACKLQIKKIMTQCGDQIPVRHIVEYYADLSGLDEDC